MEPLEDATLSPKPSPLSPKQAKGLRNRWKKAMRRDEERRRNMSRKIKGNGARKRDRRVQARDRARHPMREWFTVKEVAIACGRSETWVKEHALELRGRKATKDDVGPGHSPGWRFPRSVLDRVTAA